MLLRRITQHVTDQNWFAVFIDFLIVVVGVFIGIQVSNWNQSLKDQQDEALFYASLHQDILSVEAISSRLFNRRISAFEKLSELVDVLDGSGPPRELRKEDCRTLTGSDYFYVGRANFPALNQLRDAGRVDIIKDSQLQQALAQFSQRQESMELVLASSEHKLFDFRKMYLGRMLFGSEMMPDPTNPGTFEREPVLMSCDYEYLFNLPEVQTAAVMNLEMFDAYLRDGLMPWRNQITIVHQRLDELLGIQHTELEAN